MKYSFPLSSLWSSGSIRPGARKGLWFQLRSEVRVLWVPPPLPVPGRGVSSSRLVSLGPLSLETWYPLLSEGIPELVVVTFGSCLLTVAKEHTQSVSAVLSTPFPSQNLAWNTVKQEREMLLNQGLPKMAAAPGTQPGSPLPPAGARGESGRLCWQHFLGS